MAFLLVDFFINPSFLKTVYYFPNEYVDINRL